MSNIARLQPKSQPSVLPQLQRAGLSQADVVDTGVLTLELALLSGGERTGARVEARLAVAFQYTPTVGDRVLVVGDDDGFYVIGVLVAQRQENQLSFVGDVEVAATGKLHLRGEEGVELSGPQVQVRAGKLEMMARTLTTQYDRVRQRVVELLSLQAGTTHTVVEGSAHTRAKNATLLTKEKVSINGKSIHLG